MDDKRTKVAHDLSKQRWQTIDIFMINIKRSSDIAILDFTIIECIKDGRIFSGKYDSKTLFLRTPNTVMVFSNELPPKYKLSKDRWVIFEIIDGELVRSNSLNKSKPCVRGLDVNPDEPSETDKNCNPADYNRLDSRDYDNSLDSPEEGWFI